MENYDVNEKVKLRDLKTLAEREKAYFDPKITAAAAAAEAAFKSGKVEGNKVSIYTSVDMTGEAAFSFDFPVELVLDQAKTAFVPEFAYSADLYPETEDPGLDGKPVMVLAIKGSDGSVAYSFMGMAELVDTYEAAAGDGSTTVTVNGYKISVNVNVSAEADNALEKKADGLYVPKADVSGKADKVAGATAGNLPALDADGNLTDSGVAVENLVTEDDFATDEEVTAMLDEIFPVETAE